MSCISCAKPYSLFRKEKGCPNCGFSYCSNCLNNKVFLVKLNINAKVCAKCKKTITNEDQNVQKDKVIPPDRFLKRQMDPSKSTINTSNSTDDHILERLNKLKKDVEKTKPKDEDIHERLKNLKGETSTSNAEIEARLARLRGLPEAVTSKPTLPVVDTRTEQEQIDDLMKQYLEQTHIDSKYKDEFENLVSDMEMRINKLKGKDASIVPADTKTEQASESEDEEATVKKIVEKIKTEALLDTDLSTNDELPFCEICNEDARMRCLGCKYLFCKRCFMDHKDDDDGCNQYEPYKPPRQ